MKKVISFNENGVGVGIVEVQKAELAPHERELPDGFVMTWPPARFSLADGEIVDRFPGLDGAQALDAIHAEMKAADEERIAVAKRGISLTTVEGARAYQVAKLRKHFDNIVTAVKADAAPYEVETWATQHSEYMAYSTNVSAATPYVDVLAQVRGLTKEALMEKIGIKIANLAAAQGAQHRLEKLIEQAQTPEEVFAIAFE